MKTSDDVLESDREAFLLRNEVQDEGSIGCSPARERATVLLGMDHLVDLLHAVSNGVGSDIEDHACVLVVFDVIGSRDADMLRIECVYLIIFFTSPLHAGEDRPQLVLLLDADHRAAADVLQ